MKKTVGVLLLLLALFGLPVLAADYSRWLDDDNGSSIFQAQSSPSSPQQEDKQSPEKKGYPGRYCCVHCRHNEVPCGGKCVAPPATGKKAFCKGPPGCACSGKP